MCYTPCHAEEADRLTKHLLPMHTVEAADSSTPLRSAQNDRAHLTTDPEVTHDVTINNIPLKIREYQVVKFVPVSIL